MAMRPTVMYTPCITLSKEKTGDVITFTQYKEGKTLTETRNDTESGDESDSKSIMMCKKIWKISTKQKISMTTL